jgi:hypothetical protein
MSGTSAGAVAAATDEERRAALKATYHAQLADVRARHHARLAAMKQRLPSLSAWLRKLWQDMGGARWPAPTKVHLRATATVEKQLEKAAMLLGSAESNLAPTEWNLTEAEGYLRSAKALFEASEAQLAPAEVPPVSTDKAVVVALNEGSRSRDIGAKAASKEHRPALLLTGKTAPRKSCGERATTGFRRKGPQKTRSGAFRSGPGAFRGRPETSKDATGGHKSKV